MIPVPLGTLGLKGREHKAALGSRLQPKASQQLVGLSSLPSLLTCSPARICLLPASSAARTALHPGIQGTNALVLECPPKHTHIMSSARDCVSFLHEGQHWILERLLLK